MLNLTYEEALEYLDNTTQYGNDLSLDKIKNLLGIIGNPQNELPFVHLAGTNGKGSTAAYLATILAQAGYKVGRYISPVIIGYCERIQISQKKNDLIETKYIDEEEVAYYVSLLKEANDSMLEKGLQHPTTFEIETAMTFLYLRDKKCDIVVLETGLGGRLDATNVITSTVLSVITSISMDHMQYLGDSIEQITREKAGIIKKHVPVVSYDQVREAREVLMDKCKETGSQLGFADFNDIHEVIHDITGITFSYKNMEALRIRLLGENQVKNAVTALEAVEVLRKIGYSISEEALRAGLFNTQWRGRFEIISNNPLFVVDGAHNEDAALSLSKSIEQYFKDRRLLFIMGVFADKEYEKIIKLTHSYADAILTIETKNPRALPSSELTQVVRRYHENVIDAKNVNNAISIAMKMANKEDVIIAFGSLSFLHEIYEYFGIIL